jgi:hypothetical protein
MENRSALRSAASQGIGVATFHRKESRPTGHLLAGLGFGSALFKTVTSPFSVFAKVRNGRCSYMQFMKDIFATSASFRASGKWIFHSHPNRLEGDDLRARDTECDL